MAEKEEPLIPAKYIIIIIPVLIILYLLMAYYTEKQSKHDEEPLRQYFIWVDSTEVCGRLSYVSTKAERLETFWLENDPGRSYYAKIVPPVCDECRDFQHFAEAGDSVIKHKFSDGLILIKKGKVYNCRWIRLYIGKNKSDDH